MARSNLTPPVPSADPIPQAPVMVTAIVCVEVPAYAMCQRLEIHASLIGTSYETCMQDLVDLEALLSKKRAFEHELNKLLSEIDRVWPKNWSKDNEVGKD
jgi:hypothetical protein